MSDTTGPATEPTPPTEPLQLADQSPVYPATEPAPQKRSHTRTILEVVGAAVAAFLILGAGVVGFALGHATSDRGDHDRGAFASQSGPMAGGQGQQGQRGQGFGQGQQGQQGQGFGQGGGMMGGQRGIDPDGDNWTGGGMMGGQDPRGIDPDGDNWMGGMMGDQD